MFYLTADTCTRYMMVYATDSHFKYSIFSLSLSLSFFPLGKERRERELQSERLVDTVQYRNQEEACSFIDQFRNSALVSVAK